MSRQISQIGREIGWKGRSSSITPVLLAIPAVALSAGLAYGQTVISTAETSPRIVVADEDVTVTAGGSVTLSGADSEVALKIAVGTYTTDTLNQGTLSYHGGTADGGAVGLWLEGALSGTITNLGRIALSVMDARQVLLQGIATEDVSGTLWNQGTISVAGETSDLTQSAAFAESYGIAAGAIAGSGAVLNTGPIMATARASGSVSNSVVAGAFGIKTDTMAGTVSNSGTIVASASANGSAGNAVYAGAFGIAAVDQFTSYDVVGALSNTGMIKVGASSTGSAVTALYSEGYGIASRTMSGIMSNSGTIEVAALADGWAYDAVYAGAYGVSAADLSGTMENSGTIAARATARGAALGSVYAEAYGFVSGDVAGTMSNFGTITANARASGWASSAVYATAFGIAAPAGDLAGIVSNSGTITTTAMADGWADDLVFANAFGVQTGIVTTAGSVSNTGVIIVDAATSNDNMSGYWSALASGIDISKLDGRLFNSGRVMALAPNGGDSYAVWVGTGTGEATFTTESFFAGWLWLRNADLTVRSVADTGSIYWTFDALTDWGFLDDASGPTLFYDNNVIATVAPTNLAFSGLIAAEVAETGFGPVSSLLSGMPANGAAVMNRDDGGPKVFFQGDARFLQLNDSAGRSLDLDTAGITVGVTGQFDSGFSYGVTLSGVRADGSAPSVFGAADTMSTSGVVLGAYGNIDFGAVSLTFGGSAGMLSNDDRRSMNDNLAPNGVAMVASSYDSTFVSPAVELSMMLQSGAVTIRPYVGYRYTRLSIDGFTETGGPGAATFRARDVSVSDFTLGADASMPVGNGILSGSAEILRRDVSDGGANVALFGANGHTASAATDYTALELGVGYGVALGSGTMNFGASATFGTNDVSGYGLTASYSIRF